MEVWQSFLHFYILFYFPFSTIPNKVQRTY